MSPAGFLTDPHKLLDRQDLPRPRVSGGSSQQFHANEAPYRHTVHTLTKRSDLEREIEAILKRGYSVDDGECHMGCAALRPPFSTSDGHVVAALGITAAAVRLAEKRIPEVAAKVRTIADEAYQILGYCGAQ